MTLLQHTDNEGRLTLDAILHGLLQEDRLSAADAERYLRQIAPDAHRHPLEQLADCHLSDARTGALLDLETLTQWLAGWCERPYCRIDPLKIDVAAVTALIPYGFAKQHGILALEADADSLLVADAQPFDDRWQQDLAQVCQRRIRRCIANPADIRRHIEAFYRLAKSIDQASHHHSQPQDHSAYFDQLLHMGDAENAGETHIATIVDWLFQYAFQQRASDIHIEPRQQGTFLRFRIDGQLHEVYRFPAAIGMAVISRLKSTGHMNLAEKRRPQDGRIKMPTPSGSEVELRISTLPTVFGEKMVLRIFDPDVLLKSFTDLGFTAHESAHWQWMTQQPNGIILVTGPTGSGKTTTLYSTLKQLATPQVNVCTIEDPIEMIEPAFNQMQVQAHIDLTFANGVRALLRQDPDIIMIGEIRDTETAEIAMQAALTGHLVLSSLHTNDAPSAITRLLELGIAGHLIRATVLGVMGQRLIRRLCPHCKTAAHLPASEWQNVIAPWKMPLPPVLYRANGCNECRDSGYRGRLGIFEIMRLSDTLKARITAKTDSQSLRRQAIREGMRSLRLSGAMKVAAGETTLEELLRITPHCMGQESSGFQDSPSEMATASLDPLD